MARAAGGSGARPTFVLVHGAWHGGWSWQRVAPLLAEQASRVTTPTLTGLGERAHLISRSVDITMFIDDIANHILWEDLRNVVLVGHSFGGLVITGVADRMAERLTALLYLDALVPSDGESWGSQMTESLRKERIRLAEASSGGLSLPPPPPSAFGVEEPHDVAWLEAKLTPHPMGCLNDPLRLVHPAGNGLPCAYLSCVEPVHQPVARHRARAEALGWPVFDLPGGHDAMVTNPEATAGLILQAAEMLDADRR